MPTSDSWEVPVVWPPVVGPDSRPARGVDVPTEALAWSRDDATDLLTGTAPSGYTTGVRQRVSPRTRLDVVGPRRFSYVLAGAAGFAGIVVGLMLGAVSSESSAPAVEGSAGAAHPTPRGLPYSVSPYDLSPNRPPDTSGDREALQPPPTISPGAANHAPVPPYYPSPATQNRLNALWAEGIVPTIQNPTGAR